MSVDTDHRRKRGELRIYLGAAPGVGKTYAMLGEAHRRLECGSDLVAGVVEPRNAHRPAGIDAAMAGRSERRGTGETPR